MLEKAVTTWSHQSQPGQAVESMTVAFLQVQEGHWAQPSDIHALRVARARIGAGPRVGPYYAEGNEEAVVWECRTTLVSPLAPASF